MCDSVIIKSAQDAVLLRLWNPRWDEQEQAMGYFAATVEAGDHRGTVEVYAYAGEGLVGFFEFIAAHWRGWNGPKEWSSLEGQLSLAATSDVLGHVFLKVELSSRPGGNEWRLETNILLEANQLESLAREVGRFYYTKPTTA